MAIYVSGNISGLGTPSYYLNISRQQAFNPILVCQEQGYKFNECPISAIEYEGFSPNKIINIRSRENDIYENTLAGNNGTVYINRVGYGGTSNYFRNFEVDDGKGNSLFFINGNQGTIQAGGNLTVNGYISAIGGDLSTNQNIYGSASSRLWLAPSAPVYDTTAIDFSRVDEDDN